MAVADPSTDAQRPIRAALLLLVCAIGACVWVATNTAAPPAPTEDLESELWNPETYYNVFGDGPPLPPHAKWSRRRVRDELFKVLKAVAALKNINDENFLKFQQRIQHLKSTQLTNRQALSDTAASLRVHMQLADEAKTRISHLLASYSEGQADALRSLHSALSAAISQAKAFVAEKDGAVSSAVASVRGRLSTIDDDVTKVKAAADDVGKLATEHSSTMSEIASVVKQADAARAEVASDMASAKSAISAAEAEAHSKLSEQASAASTQRVKHDADFAALTKRLSEVNEAIGRLQSAQNSDSVSWHDAVTEAGAKAASSLDEARSSASSQVAQVAASASGAIGKVSNQANALPNSLGISAIRARAEGAVTRLRNRLGMHIANQAGKRHNLAHDLSHIKSGLAATEGSYNRTLEVVESLFVIASRMEHSSGSEAVSLVQRVDALFSDGPLASGSNNKAELDSLHSEINNVKTSHGTDVKKIKKAAAAVRAIARSMRVAIKKQGKTISTTIMKQRVSFGKRAAIVGHGVRVEAHRSERASNATLARIARADERADRLAARLARTHKKKGPTGDRGDRGTTGAPGPMGPQGKVGAPGKRGGRGPRGPTGGDGHEGDLGPAGKVGKQGPRGPRGAQGPDGQFGPPGSAGKVGPRGSRGDVGEAGALGNPGPEGPRGRPGYVGPRGKPASGH